MNTEDCPLCMSSQSLTVVMLPRLCRAHVTLPHQTVFSGSATDKQDDWLRSGGLKMIKRLPGRRLKRLAPHSQELSLNVKAARM